MSKAPRICIGVGGWTFEPWRDNFYPKGLPQKSELHYASRKLNSIEINGTFYGSQKPESYDKWYSETPEGFVFSLKGPRFTTNRKVLGTASETVDRFFNGGVLRLKEKLGPINWQLANTKKLDLEDCEAFLSLLPKEIEGQEIRHALEVRHPSFKTPEFVELLRRMGVAVVTAIDSEHPQISDPTGPFIYVRAMGTIETEENGYSEEALDQWMRRAKAWSCGEQPEALEPILATPAEKTDRDVFLYFINGHKPKNPAAAQALLSQLS